MVHVGVMTGAETPDHHGDHRGLLWEADGSVPLGNVDAIIVPTFRPVVYLREAAAAAKAVGCPLVTLHSGKWTSAHEAARYLGRAKVDLIAIDMPELADLRLPELATSRLLAGTIFERRTDTSAKRNLALMLANMLRWERVVFLDDDIKVPHPADLKRAAGLLDTHTAVGLRNTGFPDNSVVCHAFRAAGGAQGTFVGGGAMAVEVARNHSFFPNIYNEDWFYLLDGGKRLQSVATVGEVIQNKYDPYRNTGRARSEEFGDVLAEGSFWLLDQEKAVSDGDLAHWNAFLKKRQSLIEHVLKTVENSDIERAERARMVEALKAALGRRARISGESCMDYMRAWVADQEDWRRHIEGVLQEPEQPLEAALAALTRDGARLTWCTHQKCSVPERPARPGRRSRARTAPRTRPLEPGDLQLDLRDTGAEAPELGDRFSPVPAGSSVSVNGHSRESACTQG